MLNASKLENPQPYTELIEELKQRARKEFVAAASLKHAISVPAESFDAAAEADFYLDVVLQDGDLSASCDFANRIRAKGYVPLKGYEPGIIVGTQQVTGEQKMELAFVGYVLGLLQNDVPDYGTVVTASGKAHRVRLGGHYSQVKELLAALRASMETSRTAEPAVFLIEHCECCQFRSACLEVARQEDSLSLLDRMTPKVANAYNKKGIFTVNQLSYTFRPRRSRKQPANATAHFKFELQALAIRTGKTYVHKLPDIPKSPAELYLDIEGVPGRGFDYLVGILLADEEVFSHHTFWANSSDDELEMWKAALAFINANPAAPIYHYGSYEQKAMDRLASRYQIDCENVKKRMININPSIFGRIYFPSRSNGLKDLAKHLGFAWSSPHASGLQSLVWREQWERTLSQEYKAALTT